MNILGLISQLIGIKTLRLTERNMADPLTKPLARKLVSETSGGIGLIPKL